MPEEECATFDSWDEDEREQISLAVVLQAEWRSDCVKGCSSVPLLKLFS